MWLVLEVDRVTVALLQDAGVEVVLVLRVQLPAAANVRARHVVPAHLRLSLLRLLTKI